MKKVLINNEPIEVAKTKVVFGNLNAPVPEWAKWVFRGWATFTTAASFYVAATTLIPASGKTEVLLALKSSDMLILGLSKMFGIVKK